MTTTFDALIRLLRKYRDDLEDLDYNILYHFIDACHDFQHSMNSHELDGYIEKNITTRSWLKDRFDDWRADRI